MMKSQLDAALAELGFEAMPEQITQGGHLNWRWKLPNAPEHLRVSPLADYGIFELYPDEATGPDSVDKVVARVRIDLSL